MKLREMIKYRQPSNVERKLSLDELVAKINVTSEEQQALVHFIETFLPLLIADLSGIETELLRDSVSKEIAESALSMEWKWAEKFFVKKAVDGFQFDEEMTPDREARVCVLYNHLAEFINYHRDFLGKPLLGWAYWNYEEYFSKSLKLEESYLEELIDSIEADELLASFRLIDGFDVEYYRSLLAETYTSSVVKWEVLSNGSDYGELPEWIGYVSLYLQDAGNLTLLGKLFQRLSYPILQSTLSYHVSASETAYNLLKGDNDEMLNLVCLEMWHRDLAKEGATLQLYENRQKGVRRGILKEGSALFRQWKAEIPMSVEQTFKLIETRYGWHTLFEWNFSTKHRQGSGLYTKEIREQVDEFITESLKQAFVPKMLTLDDANQAYLKFVCEHNLGKFNDKNSWYTLKSVIERLFDDIHERPVPKFEAESLHLWRGYAYAFVNTCEILKNDTKNRLNELKVYFEGYLDEEDSSLMLEKIYKESFTLSSFMLIAEMDEIDQVERESIFAFVVDRVFRQIEATYGEGVRLPYLVSLQMAILVASQIMQTQLSGVLQRAAYELPVFYEVKQTIDVAKSLDDETKKILRDRWEDEKEVIKLRSCQIDHGRKFKELEKWIGETA